MAFLTTFVCKTSSCWEWFCHKCDDWQYLPDLPGQVDVIQDLLERSWVYKVYFAQAKLQFPFPQMDHFVSYLGSLHRAQWLTRWNCVWSMCERTWTNDCRSQVGRIPRLSTISQLQVKPIEILPTYCQHNFCFHHKVQSSEILQLSCSHCHPSPQKAKSKLYCVYGRMNITLCSYNKQFIEHLLLLS